MFVRMLFEIQGTRNGKPWPRRGGLIELPADEAKRLVEQGLAAHIDAPVALTEAIPALEIETAETVPAVIEIATVPTVRKARGKRS
jgi:hypothetical protein